MSKNTIDAIRRTVRNRLFEWITDRRDRHGLRVDVLDATRGIDKDQLWRNLNAALDLIHEHRPVWLRRMRRMGVSIHVRRTPGNRAKLVGGTESILDSWFVAHFLPAQIAASLVHEATHARMRACGIGFAAGTPAREERACRRSEVRFGRVLLAAGVEGAAAVLERAEGALALPDEAVGPVVDWKEVHTLEVVTRIDELPFPPWLKRMVARRNRVLHTPQGQAAFGKRK